METKKTEQIFILRTESFMGSVMADAVTLGFIAILFAFNHYFLNDSVVAAIAFFVVFIIHALGRANKHSIRFHSKEALKEYASSL